MVIGCGGRISRSEMASIDGNRINEHFTSSSAGILSWRLRSARNEMVERVRAAVQFHFWLTLAFERAGRKDGKTERKKREK